MGHKIKPGAKCGNKYKKMKWGTNQILNNAPKDRWDKSKTLLENFSLMGLKLTHKRHDLTQVSLDKLGMKADPIKLKIKEAAPKGVSPLSWNDQHYYRELMLKHGDKYDKMQMDIKLNNRQLTAKELEKGCRKFIVLYGHPLVTDITFDQYQEQQEKEKKEQEEKERQQKEKEEKEEKARQLKLKQQQQKSNITDNKKGTSKQISTPAAAKSKQQASSSSIKIQKTPISKPKETVIIKKKK
ncbi:hypothetical protein DLAC_06615 [Tieghemostelium lacteum]|uniref:Nucleolar protein 16 n=1 Tax=Tieghemostelium lacteum TaxID=361077 RepID=A0A151ZFD3_TIELA|nr:hypothetical protein DLAC_06615 [Tieghemostelium lacteum]|eukprot:KYQ92619.1 hypothetical protein DLAC_06615 [Tieghemostelium lacteum]